MGARRRHSAQRMPWRVGSALNQYRRRGPDLRRRDCRDGGEAKAAIVPRASHASDTHRQSF
jgi:hypothetical protein